MIQGKDSNGVLLTLCYHGNPVEEGDTLINFRGQEAVVRGGQPPHAAHSEGRILVRHDNLDREFYPSVYGCKWEAHK